MNRFVCGALLSALMIASPLFSTKEVSGLNMANFSEELAAQEQPNFLEEKLPWLNSKLTTWKTYLAEKPAMKHVQPKSNEEVSAHFSHEWAMRAFNAAGKKSDPSTLTFGRQSFLMKDAFVASKLLADDEAKVVPKIDAAQPLPNNNRHFLCLLAGQELSFVSTHSRQELLVSYQRSFFDKHLQVSVDIPFARVERHLDLAAAGEISKANRAALVDATAMNSPLVRNAMGDMRPPVDAPGFYEQYNDMDTFLQSVLNGAGVQFAKKQEETGLGDVVVSCVYDQSMSYIDNALLGVSLSLNTAKSSRNIALAEPVLGDSASTLKAFAHFSWHRSLIANPFMKMSLGYSLPTTVGVRLPYALTYNGVDHIGKRMSDAFPRTIPFSDILTLGGSAFSQLPETEIGCFASTIQKVTLHKGLSYGFTIGNTFEQCFGKPMYATCSYSFAGRQQQHFSDIEKAALFAPHVVTRNTATKSHIVDVLLGYRLSPLCTIEGGMRSCFAGKNTLKTTQVFGGLSLRF